MTKKMKGVALGSSPYGVYEDDKTRFKHQTLVQDYQELRKEAEAVRNKLEIMKRRKLTLLAEVRFLRQRYKFLLKNKSAKPPQERGLSQQPTVETHHKKKLKEQIYKKKVATLPNLPPIFNLTQKGKVYMGKETALQNATPIFYLNPKETLHTRKEAALHNPTLVSNSNQRGRIFRGKGATVRNATPVIDLNLQERMYIGKGAASRNPAPAFDLNQKESSFSGKEAASQSQIPIFDLNQISREEEEFQDNGEPLRLEELKLSVCRNIGDGSSRAGKRKISWQDPVALKA